MTALAQYARLETSGLWRPEANAAPRGVTVALGEATLVMTDEDGTALAHWSLPALERIGAGLPALYAPGDEAAETLEIEEPDMVDAIERVRRVVRRGGRRRGRIGRALAGLALLVGLAAGALALPGALREHALAVVPPEARAEIGAALLGRMEAEAGRACAGPAGVAALAALSARLFDPAPRIVVLPGEMAAAALLPGGTIVLPRSAVEAVDAPEAAAGWAIEAAARAEPPLAALLERGGLRQGVHLLTTGTLSPELIAAHAQRLLAEPAAPVPAAELLAGFAAAGVSSGPYALARAAAGRPDPALVAGDPHPGGRGARPVLSDDDWVALQGICEG